MIDLNRFSIVYENNELKLVDGIDPLRLSVLPPDDGLVSSSKKITYLCDEYDFVIDKSGKKIYLYQLSKRYLINKNEISEDVKLILTDPGKYTGKNKNIYAHHKNYDKQNDNPENILICSYREHLRYHGLQRVPKPYNSLPMIESNHNPELNQKRQESQFKNGNYDYNPDFRMKPKEIWTGREQAVYKNYQNGHFEKSGKRLGVLNSSVELKVKQLIGKAFSVISLCKKMNLEVKKLNYEKVRIDNYPRAPRFSTLNNRFSFDRIVSCYEKKIPLEDIVRTALKKAEIRDKEPL